jgi:hypothetical protein
MKKLLLWLPVWCLSFVSMQVDAQNISITGSCTQGIANLELGGDPLLTALNGRPVYYNAAVQVDYASSIVGAVTYLFYETAANLGTPEDRWVITFDGQPYYYFISAAMTAPTGGYLPFDPGAPVSMCGGAVTASPSSPLSVELVSFAGRAEGLNHLLTWTTATESGSDFFEVERSHDGLSFRALGQVQSLAPNGNSATALAYTYTDAEPLQGHNYYRLTQTDFDGKRQVSSAVIDIRNGNSSAWTIYPNPVENRLNIRSAVNPNILGAFAVLDPAGRTLLSGSLEALTTGLDVSGLSSGHYVLVLQGAEQEQQVLRFFRN